MYGGNPEMNLLMSQHAGNEFEDGFVFATKKAFKDSKVYKVKNLTGTNVDYTEGTDLMIGEIRIDPTINFDNKDYMPFVADTGIVAVGRQTWQMGVRHGNSHKGYQEFKEPVVVIGLNMSAQEYRANEDAILESLEKNAEDLMVKADDCLLDYTTTDSYERLDLYDTPLKPNSNYKEPKRIGDRYKAYNNINRFLTEDSDDTQIASEGLSI